MTGYERPGLESGADANWVSGEVELTAWTTGSFSGRQAVSLRTEELARFCDQLARLVETLEGEAVLDHLEDRVGCTIRLTHGTGEFEGYVREDIGAELRVTGLRTDQSYLQQALLEMKTLVESFPVRGDSSG